MVWPNRAFLQENDMPDEETSPATPKAEPNLPGTPAPGMERLEKAGKKGWKFTDGSILWDDGEKEVPTSGLSDEFKRAEARIAAGDLYGVTKTGITDQELAHLQADHASMPSSDKILEVRKADAKKRAGHKPDELRAPPPTEVEYQQGLRLRTKQMLEREIDRLEELKTLAIAGTVELTVDGHAAATVHRSNPPMALHEAVLGYLRISDQGSPQQMLKALEDARRWQAKS
jgi:hypothetical protein